jgi:hypothetical protein
MKRRLKKAPTKWRIVWSQVVDGAARSKWHTGSQYECDVLRRVCEAAGEHYRLSEPGTFKE